MKARNKVYITLCLLVGTGLALSHWFPAKPEAHHDHEEDHDHEPNIVAIAEIAPPAAPVTAASKAELRGRSYNERLDTPDLSVIRNEVRKNPHSTPPSLLRFAEQVGTEMEAAKTSPEKAETLFKKFEFCVRNGEKDRSPPSVQALCLWNADRLSTLFPQALSTRNESLAKSAPQDVRDLLKVMSL